MKRATSWIFIVAAAIALVAGVVVAIVLHGQPSWGQPVESAAATGAALLTAVTAVAAATSASTSAQAAELARRSLAMHAPPTIEFLVKGNLGETPVVTFDVHDARVKSLSVTWTPQGGNGSRTRRFSPVPGMSFSCPLEGVGVQTVFDLPDASLGTEWAVLDQLYFQLTDASGFRWTSGDARRTYQPNMGEPTRGFSVRESVPYVETLDLD